MRVCVALELMLEFFVCGAGCSSYGADEYSAATILLSENCDSNRVEETTRLKSAFVNVVPPPVMPVGNHTHGESAAIRSAASAAIEQVGESTGLKVSYVQCSSSDLRANREGSRLYFWAKDLMAPPILPVRDPTRINALVDVDYYLDMEKRLVLDFQPHVLYTFQPTGVCRDQGEYKYTFLHDGSVEYLVSGGGEYRHKVWNYDGDSIMVTKKFLGITTKVATYAVERKRMDDDHQLVLLAPLASYKGVFMCWVAKNFVKARRLERLDVVDGEFTRLKVNTNEGLFVCTGKVGGYTQARVPARVDDAIAATKNTLSMKLTLATVKAKMEDNDHSSNKTHVGAEVLTEYHRHGQGRTERISALTAGVRRYQYVPAGAEADVEAKPGMHAFMNPIVDGGFVPDMCAGNDARAIEERVRKIRSEELPVTKFVATCMGEFIDRFYGGRRNFLEPCENHVVYERQNRPAQRVLLEQAQHEQATSVTRSFVKKEAYGSVNDPRLISTICPRDKMHYSAFIYPLADHLKTLPWYAFGKSPLEIAERVSEICGQAKWVDVTDFSRMDGRVGNVARELEHQLMLRGFKSSWHAELFELMGKQTSLRGRTQHGVSYDTGLSRLSGSAETSAFNTVLNAFVCFMAYRRCVDVFGSYLDAQSAWESLGLYGGDDGLSANLTRKCAFDSAKSVGQKLDLERFTRGESGVHFLARHYGPDVWFGDNNSCCSLKRQLAKFHLSVATVSSVAPKTKLAEKAFAFSLTDSATPVIGAFVARVLELYPCNAETYTNVCGLWVPELDAAKQYPNRPADWMEDLLKKELPRFDAEMFKAWLAQSDGSTIFSPPKCTPSIEAAPRPGRVVVDDDLVGAHPPTDANESEDTPPSVRLARPRKKKNERPSRLQSSTAVRGRRKPPQPRA